MPPAVTFLALACPAAPPGPDTIDLAGEALPRCTVELPQAAEAGLYLGSCPCGVTFALGVRGDPGDPSKIVLRCWPEPIIAPMPTRQPNLFR